MSINISRQQCEICGENSAVAMNDDTNKLRFCCLEHIDELWDKIGKP